MLKPTKKEVELKKYKEYRDICPKNYDLNHVWRDGQIYSPFVFFGHVLPFGKTTTLVKICHSCGLTKEL